MGDGGGVVVVSTGHVGRKRGSGIVSSTADVLWMRGLGGACEMCMCLARSGVVGEGVSGFGLGFTIPVRTMGSVARMSVFGLRWCVLYKWGVGRWLRPRSGWMGWFYVCVSCESELFV